jgi:hypothetical protein
LIGGLCKNRINLEIIYQVFTNILLNNSKKIQVLSRQSSFNNVKQIIEKFVDNKKYPLLRFDVRFFPFWLKPFCPHNHQTKQRCRKDAAIEYDRNRNLPIESPLKYFDFGLYT